VLKPEQDISPCSLEDIVFKLQDKLQAASCLEGRPAAIEALLAVSEFLSVISAPNEFPYQRPFNSLTSALKALDDGEVQPLLQPMRRSGRSPDSLAKAYVKALAVRIAQRLCEAGMDKAEAYEKVALVCRKCGIRPGRKGSDKPCEMTARTVRFWSNQISKDVRCRTRLGRFYREISCFQALERATSPGRAIGTPKALSLRGCNHGVM
jgi:hypothetical protein